MNTKVTTQLLIAFCIFHSIYCETVDDVIAELRPKVADEKTAIDAVIRSGGDLIGQTRRSIGLAVNNGENLIHDQLNQLDTLLNQAQQEANQKGVDVSKCVNTANTAVSALNINKIQLCSTNQELDVLGVELGNLGILKRTLSNSINVCLSKNSVDLQALRNCVQNDIDNAQVKVDEIQTRLTTVCDDATNKATECVNGAVEELDTSIAGIASDLKKCLSGLL